MKAYKNCSVSKVLLTAFVCLLALTSNAVAQTQNKVVEIHQNYFHNMPGKVIEIYDIRQGTEPVKLGSAFEAGEAWLRTFTFKVKNTSTKSITHIGNDFYFPETEAVRPMLRFTISYGQISGVTDKLPDWKPIRIKPGESIEVTFTEKYYNELKSALGEKFPIGKINKVTSVRDKN